MKPETKNKGLNWMAWIFLIGGILGLIVAFAQDCNGQELSALAELDSIRETSLISSEGDTTYNVLEYYSVPGLANPVTKLKYEEYLTAEELADALRTERINDYIELSYYYRRVANDRFVFSKINDIDAIYQRLTGENVRDVNRAEYTSQFEGFYTLSFDTVGVDPAAVEWDSLDVTNGRLLLRVYINESGIGRQITNWGQAINRDSSVVYNTEDDFARVRLFSDYTPQGAPNTNSMLNVVIQGRSAIPGAFSVIGSDARVPFSRSIFVDVDGVLREFIRYRSLDDKIILTKLITN